MLGADLICFSFSSNLNNSCKVVSGCAFNVARMAASTVANLCDVPRTWDSEAQLSVFRCRANQRSIDGLLTLYRLAAYGVLLSTLSITRSRKYAFIPPIMPSNY
jgi:hypothetical protein